MRKIKQGKLQDGFSERDVYRNKWKHLGDKESVTMALEELHLACWIKPVELEYSGTGRKPGKQYLINPKLKTLR